MDIFAHLKNLAVPLQCCDKCRNFLQVRESNCYYCDNCYYYLTACIRFKDMKKKDPLSKPMRIKGNLYVQS